MLNQEDIIKGCRKNESSAQKQLYDLFNKKMYGICLRYISDRDAAKDILQDAFVKVFMDFNKYKGEGSFEGWLKRVVINMALDHVKKSQRIKFVSTDNFDLAEKEESAETGLDVLLNAGFSADDLLVMLQNIQTDYALVFNMFYIDKLSHKEIAELLTIDENTSRTRLFRAKVQLKKELEKQLTKLRKN